MMPKRTHSPLLSLFICLTWPTHRSARILNRPDKDSREDLKRGQQQRYSLCTHTMPCMKSTHVARLQRVNPRFARQKCFHRGMSEIWISNSQIESIFRVIKWSLSVIDFSSKCHAGRLLDTQSSFITFAAYILLDLRESWDWGGCRWSLSSSFSSISSASASTQSLPAWFGVWTGVWCVCASRALEHTWTVSSLPNRWTVTINSIRSPKARF